MDQNKCSSPASPQPDDLGLKQEEVDGQESLASFTTEWASQPSRQSSTDTYVMEDLESQWAPYETSGWCSDDDLSRGAFLNGDCIEQLESRTVPWPSPRFSPNLESTLLSELHDMTLFPNRRIETWPVAPLELGVSDDGQDDDFWSTISFESRSTTHVSDRSSLSLLSSRPSSPCLGDEVEDQGAPVIQGHSTSCPKSKPTRQELDNLLVSLRKKGYSYKHIMREHDFGVSESTLRGRHRLLTKTISERPRKPQWTRKDVRLLLLAVRRARRGSGKYVSWKKVSEFIWDHGGSHKFGFATCRRKYNATTQENV